MSAEKKIPEQALVHDLLLAEDKEKIYYSFEYFPPKTEKGEENLKAKLPLFAKQKPIFMDFTWGAGGTTAGQTPGWCSFVANNLGLPANMHLTCTNMVEGKVKEALDWCKDNGVKNLVALRGDPPAGEQWKASAEGFTCALDLVVYIRKNYGDFFSICVAGYPEGHPDVIPAEGQISEEAMMKEYEYLKKKQDAGANAIITQLFYDNNHFKKFVTRCREMGITIPILPGMLPMLTYAGLQRMVSLCKTDVPAAIKAKTEEYKDDDAKFKAYGIELCAEMCKDLKEFGINHFHFYTLNQEAASFAVLKKLGVEIHEEKKIPKQALVHDLLLAEDKEKIYYSFEYFPPKTEKGEENLKAKLPLFAKQKPIFMDFTWGAGGTTAGQTPGWCSFVANNLGLPANMHLTCTNMVEGKVKEALDWCKDNGVKNLVALRGDPPAGEQWKASAEGFTCALDLVVYIRKNYGDFFSICVAGYPEGHPDVIPAEGQISEEAMMKEYEYLKKKQDAGANAIITQLFYDNNHFKKFVTRCREMGITIPILPGMLPMLTYAGLQRMVSLCKTDVPAAIKAKTEEYKDDDAKFKAYGIELCAEMCKDLKEFGINHFHFYTLNQEAASFAVIKKLGVELEA